MKKCALTGGVGCGKSTVAQILQEDGWKVIDADEIVSELYKPGEAGHQKIVDNFGGKVLNSDHTVNRVALSRLIFSNAAQRELLNSLIHPLVRTVWQQRYHELIQKDPATRLLVVIPLLFETGTDQWFDSIACVGCAEQIQRERLKAKGIQFIDQRISTQESLNVKLQKSHIVIWNNGSREHLAGQVRLLKTHWNQF